MGTELGVKDSVSASYIDVTSNNRLTAHVTDIQVSMTNALPRRSGQGEVRHRTGLAVAMGIPLASVQRANTLERTESLALLDAPAVPQPTK